MKRTIGWIAFGLSLLWVIKNPEQASALAHQIGQAITSITNGHA